MLVLNLGAGIERGGRLWNKCRAPLRSAYCAAGPAGAVKIRGSSG